MDLPTFNHTFFLAIAAYTVGVASPGPSNLAIMAAAVTQGRTHAMALASGIISGSAFWGFSAALGMSALMRTYSWSLVVLKILGGVYMLWLAWRSARAALSSAGPAVTSLTTTNGFRSTYARGLALHLTNPKAIFVWVSIVALAMPAAATAAFALQVVAVCAVIGATVFLSYAFAFSTPLARAVYARIHRVFNATLSLVFAWAGIQLLWSAIRPTDHTALGS